MFLSNFFSKRQPIVTLSLKIIAFIVVVGGLITAFYALGLNNYLTYQTLVDERQALQNWIAHYPYLSPIIFMIAYALMVALSLPGATLFTLSAGFLFGLIGGTLYAVIGATIGAVAVFLIVRFVLRDYFETKMSGERLRRFAQGFEDGALSYLLILRLIPIFPFWVVNIVPALFKISTPLFTATTFFGIIPGAAVYASLGAGLDHFIRQDQRPDLGIIFEPQILGPLIGLALLSLLPVLYKKFFKKGS